MRLYSSIQQYALCPAGPKILNSITASAVLWSPSPWSDHFNLTILSLLVGPFVLISIYNQVKWTTRERIHATGEFTIKYLSMLVLEIIERLMKRAADSPYVILRILFALSILVGAFVKLLIVFLCEYQRLVLTFALLEFWMGCLLYLLFGIFEFEISIKISDGCEIYGRRI